MKRVRAAIVGGKRRSKKPAKKQKLEPCVLSILLLAAKSRRTGHFPGTYINTMGTYIVPKEHLGDNLEVTSALSPCIPTRAITRRR